MTKNLPNFLIVGTAKAATTTIHEYLKQHPDIFMTEWKEPCFFKFKDQEEINYTSTKRIVKFVTKTEQYKSLFKGGEYKKIRGESSTPYLYFYKDSINNIKNTVPDYQNIKILIVLRNPIERAFSQYMMKVRDLEEQMNFMEAISLEKERMRKHVHFDFYYVDRGMYYEQVKAYLEAFKNVKVVLYEDFKRETVSNLDEIVSFLGLKSFNFSTIRNHNISGKPKNKYISRLLIGENFLKKVFQTIIPKSQRKKISSAIMERNLKRITIDEASKKALQGYFKEDIKKLESLLGRDLSAWYKY